MTGVLQISCAELLGINYKNNFFGNIFNYSATEVLSIKGRIDNIGNNDTVSGVWSGMSDYLSSSQYYDSVIINGINIGTGHVISYNFNSGPDVQSKPYSLSIEIPRTGNLFNASVSGYEDIYQIRGIFESGYIQNINEDYSFINEKSGHYTSSKNLSFSIDSGVGVNRITLAQIIASGLFQQSVTLPILLQEYPDFYSEKESNRIINESYDEINGNYSFTETIKYQSGLSWLWNYVHSFNIDRGGISTVTENGNIQSARLSNSGSTNKFDYALSGWASVSTGIWPRVSGFYYAHSGIHGAYTGCPLISSPQNKQTTKNKCAGIIDYSYQYTNSPNFYSGYTYSIEQSISYDSDRYAIISENGNIQGLLQNREDRFDYISGIYFNEIKPAISGHISNIYYNSFSLMSTGCLEPRPLALISTEESFSEWEGNIDYNFSYSENPDYINSNLFFKITQTVDDQRPVHLVNYFEIVNDQSLPQRSNQSTLGKLQNNITIIGKSGTALNSYITAATSRVITPTGKSDVHITDCNYSLDPFRNEFHFDLSYAYSRYREITDIIV